MSLSDDFSSARSGLVHDEPLLFEKSSPGRVGYSLPPAMGDRSLDDIPTNLRRTELPELPEMDEPSVIRHYTHLSTWNHGVDTGMYPLGSCTMKHNPRINERTARLGGFSLLHPYTPEEHSQGALQLIWQLADYLAEISGFDRVCLQPAAGAHGELCGIKMVRAYHKAQGNPRKIVLVPDTAHGTNPATSQISGYTVREVASGAAGVLEPEAVKEVMSEDVAALMVTNPNTLGLFEQHIAEIAQIIHDKGGLVYCDGANLNSLMGIARPGDMGIDLMQFNLHKTFSTPHGGGGPGSGPVGIQKKLEPFLPIPVVEKRDQNYFLDYDRPQSIGRLKSFYGNVGVMVRAYTYIREMGAQGLRQATQMAVLNANYVRAKLADSYHLPYTAPSMHEVVFSDKHLENTGVTTMDVAKKLIDYGFHPPTVYFPLVVSGAMMIEPTETESKETLDEFVRAMLTINQLAQTDPQSFGLAPQKTIVTRLDEVQAARKPILVYDNKSKS